MTIKRNRENSLPSAPLYSRFKVHSSLIPCCDCTWVNRHPPLSSVNCLGCLYNCRVSADNRKINPLSINSISTHTWPNTEYSSIIDINPTPSCLINLSEYFLPLWLWHYLLAITTLSEPILCGPFSFFFLLNSVLIGVVVGESISSSAIIIISLPFHFLLRESCRQWLIKRHLPVLRCKVTINVAINSAYEKGVMISCTKGYIELFSVSCYMGQYII